MIRRSLSAVAFIVSLTAMAPAIGAERTQRIGIPKSDPHRFSILVAHIESDRGGEVEKRLFAVLRDFPEIQVLPLDLTIVVGRNASDGFEGTGHELARQFLIKSGASMLIWGTVLRYRGQETPRLYLRIKPLLESGEVENEPIQETRLPDSYWPDLADLLRLNIAGAEATVSGSIGQSATKRLPALITSSQKLLADRLHSSEWNEEDRVRILLMLAGTSNFLARKTGQENWMKEAISDYREASREDIRRKAPMLWATVQERFGDLLIGLNSKKDGIAYLQEAITAYQEALKELTRARNASYWAKTQFGLGAALEVFGERRGDDASLEAAVHAYRQALQEITRERAPFEWAAIKRFLGQTLWMLGVHQNGKARLEESVVAYQEALKEIPRSRAPLAWAKTQDLLGAALEALGQRESGTARLEQAMAAYRASLEVYRSTNATDEVSGSESNLRRVQSLISKRKH